MSKKRNTHTHTFFEVARSPLCECNPGQQRKEKEGGHRSPSISKKKKKKEAFPFMVAQLLRKNQSNPEITIYNTAPHEAMMSPHMSHTPHQTLVT